MPDLISLQVFHNLFSSVAKEMGATPASVEANGKRLLGA